MTDNQIDPVVAKRWVGEIERKFDDLLSERGLYMSKCKGIREQINDLKEAADNAGIPKRALNQILKERGLERKIEALRNNAEDEVAELADQLREALGEFADLPLGAAAVEKAEAKGGAKGDAKAGATGKGAAKKKATADQTTIDEAIKASSGGDALSSLITGDASDEKDVRPAFLRRDKDAIAAEQNAEALKAGIKPLH